MKHTKLALFTVLLFASLSACTRDQDAPVAEASAPEPAAVPEAGPVAAAPAITDPAATPAPAVDEAAAGNEDDEDLPHSGGDKVGKPPSN